MLIISCIRLVIDTRYEIIKFIKFLKRSRTNRACISNIKRRKKRREPRSCKLEKGKGRKKDFILQKK